MKYVALRDIAAIVDGPFGSSLKLSDYVPEGIPVLQGNNITGNKFNFKGIRFISEKKAVELSRSKVKEGDILLVKIGSIGYAAIIDNLQGYPYAIIPANLAKVTIDKAKVDPKYLVYFLTSEQSKKKLISLASKTAQPALSLSKFKEFKIPVPSLTEQIHIAQVLDQADRLRHQDRQLMDHYEQLVQSIFRDLFGDPMRNDKGWPMSTIGESIEFLTSGSRGWAKYYSESGSKFLRIQNLVKGQLRLNDIAYVNAPSTAEAKRTKVQTGDVLLSITADLGRVAFIPEGFDEAYISQHLALIRLKEEFNPSYISQLLISEFGQRQIKRADKGGVKAGLNFNDIKSLKIYTPPLALQQQFAQILTEIEAQKALAQQLQNQSEALFNSLLQRAFRGELKKPLPVEELKTGQLTFAL
jgi:type I restriction enzyme S subunit